MKETNDLAAVIRNTRIESTPSCALKQHLDWFRTKVGQSLYDDAEVANDANYACACAYPLLKALPESGEWIDQRVAELFAEIQIDIHAAKLRSYIGHALRARKALDTYLQSEGDLEERIALALQSTWLGATKSEERAVVEGIVDSHMADFAKDVNHK